MAFQDNLAKALANVSNSKGISQTATDFASAIESRIGGGPALAGIHAAIVAVVSMAAGHAKPMPASQDETAELRVRHAALAAEVQALRDAANSPPLLPSPDVVDSQASG